MKTGFYYFPTQVFLHMNMQTIYILLDFKLQSHTVRGFVLGQSVFISETLFKNHQLHMKNLETTTTIDVKFCLRMRTSEPNRLEHDVTDQLCM